MTNAKPELEVFRCAQIRRMTTGGNYINLTADVVLASEAAALISQLTAERDDLRTTAKLLLGWKDRAEAAEQRVKELEEGRDLDKVVLDEGIEIINELESSNKLLSERVAVLEALVAESDENIEALAKSIHDTDSHYFVPWMKQTPRYRSQERRKVRDVLSALRRARTALEGK